MPADIITKTAAFSADWTPIVSTKDNLGDALWTPQPRLRCDQLVRRVNGIDKANLRREFSEHGYLHSGPTMPTGWPYDTAATEPAGLASLEGKYVRIDIPFTSGGSSVWYGYIHASGHDRRSLASTAVGKQTFTAVGLEWFLGRTQIDTAVVADASSGATFGDTRRISRAFTFNGGDPTRTAVKYGNRGNKAAHSLAFRAGERSVEVPTATASASASYLSTDGTISLTAGATVTTPKDWSGAAPTAPTSVTNQGLAGLSGDSIEIAYVSGAWELDAKASVIWDADEVVDYLLLHHNPRKPDAVTPSPCKFLLKTGANTLEHGKIVLRTERQTVLSLLNAIASPARGVVWYGTLAEPVQSPSGGQITEPQFELHFASLAPSALPLTTDGGTLPANGNQYSLDTDGDSTCSRSTVGEDLSGRYDQIKCRGARMTSTFTVATGDGSLVKDWNTTDETAYLAGASADAGYPSDLTEQQQANDLRRAELTNSGVFSAFRVPEDWNGKTGDGSSGYTVQDTFPEISPNGSVLAAKPVYIPSLVMQRTTRLPLASESGQGDEFEPPIAVLQTPGGKWGLAHDMADVSDTAGEKLASYRVSRGQTGMSFRLHSGLSHTLGLNNWTGAAPSRAEPEIDYATLRCTMTAEADLFAEGTYGTGAPTDRPLEELVIDVGNGYRLDFLAEGTITGVEKGALVTNSTAQVLRDDRIGLRAIATLAYAWYQTPRRRLSLAWNQPHNLLELGWMITTLGDASPDSVNAVVGTISHDFLRHTTAVETVGAETVPIKLFA